VEFVGDVVAEVLLEEARLLDAVGVPLEGQRPVGDRAQESVRHRGVVVPQVRLGDADLRPQLLVRARQSRTLVS
jgi:hypothetical protein